MTKTTKTTRVADRRLHLRRLEYPSCATRCASEHWRPARQIHRHRSRSPGRSEPPSWRVEAPARPHPAAGCEASESDSSVRAPTLGIVHPRPSSPPAGPKEPSLSPPLAIPPRPRSFAGADLPRLGTCETTKRASARDSRARPNQSTRVLKTRKTRKTRPHDWRAVESPTRILRWHSPRAHSRCGRRPPAFLPPQTTEHPRLGATPESVEAVHPTPAARVLLATVE